MLRRLVSLPEALTQGANDISRFALVISIAAIGMKSNLGQLLEVGLKPILLLLLETLWIAGLILISLPFI
jgi:uncharacterized membrane protein YadS